jgi:hypothetical protein
MRRALSFLAASLLVSLIVQLTYAQDLPADPSPTLPPSFIGPQLIVWSHVQKPEPLPDAQSQQRDELSQTTQDQRPSIPTETLVGTIVKDEGDANGGYVLMVSNGLSYRLDDQRQARQYENKKVRVVGTLIERDHILRVVSIDIIS